MVLRVAGHAPRARLVRGHLDVDERVVVAAGGAGHAERWSAAQEHGLLEAVEHLARIDVDGWVKPDCRIDDVRSCAVEMCKSSRDVFADESELLVERFGELRLAVVHRNDAAKRAREHEITRADPKGGAERAAEGVIAIGRFYAVHDADSNEFG